MSSVRLGRPLMAASFIGGVATVATFLALLSSPPMARSQTLVSSRNEVKLCDLTFCSWNESAPTASAFSHAFSPPGLLSMGSLTDCIGCTPGEAALFDPRGFAFGLAKLHGKAGAPGREISEAA